MVTDRPRGVAGDGMLLPGQEGERSACSSGATARHGARRVAVRRGVVLDVRQRRAAAQSDRCTFQIDNVDRQGSVVETPQGTNYFAGGNVRLSCRGTQITMQSDSVAAYGGNVVQFIGRVKYRDSTLTMDADRGTYYKIGERWEARGKVTTREPGDRLHPDRPLARLLPGGARACATPSRCTPPAGRHQVRPRATRPAQPPEPYLIVADRVRFKGNDRICAGGKVTIDRSDFAARGPTRSGSTPAPAATAP